jgi:hypothetical protein
MCATRLRYAPTGVPTDALPSGPGSDGVNRLTIIRCAEDRRACHQNVRSSGSRVKSGAGIYAPIDLDVNLQSALFDHFSECADLGEDVGDESLSAEPRIHRHEQYEVDVLEDVLDEGERRVRVEADADPRPGRADDLQRAVQVGTGLDVDRDRVRPGLAELRDVGVGPLDHQVNVERQRGGRARRRDDQRADGEVRDEVAVHHVDVNPVGPGGGNGGDLLAQAAEVAGENRGGDEQVGHRRASYHWYARAPCNFAVRRRPDRLHAVRLRRSSRAADKPRCGRHAASTKARLAPAVDPAAGTRTA